MRGKSVIRSMTLVLIRPDSIARENSKLKRVRSGKLSMNRSMTLSFIRLDLSSKKKFFRRCHSIVFIIDV
jgi:hypothetical protein